jgi:hypothetical protein
MDTLDGLLEKSQTQLAESQQKETTALHNFEMLKQSLEDEIKFATKDSEEAKKGVAGGNEEKSTAEGDLAVTSKQQKRKQKMIDKANKAVGSITALGIALLALAIVAQLLVGASNMAFLGNVVGNITALVAELGSAGLAGLISLGVVLWLFNR